MAYSRCVYKQVNLACKLNNGALFRNKNPLLPCSSYSAHLKVHRFLSHGHSTSNYAICKSSQEPILAVGTVSNLHLVSSYICRRNLHLSTNYLDKSKLEDSLKEKKKKKQTASTTKPTSEAAVPPPVEASDGKTMKSATLEVVKPSLWSRFVTEVKHYYNGFRLLALDVRIASRTLWKILRGKNLLRRELNQFRRAVADIFRLAPFSVFIIIPFAELALPIAVKLFPGMLPSTFETKSKREVRLKKELKVKLEMAKFLQDTVEDIAVHTSQAQKKQNSAQDFVNFFKKIRNSDEDPTNEEILKHAKLFQNELTLDNMDRPQLVALCRLIQVSAVGTNELLRLLIRMKLNRLHSDDLLIKQEGIDSLTTLELMTACQARGMRALGVPRNRLKQQLAEWVDLHLNQDVPSSLLLLTRVLYLPENLPAETKVKAAISTLPEKVAGEAEVRAAEINLERVDNTTRYKAAKLENAEIAEEKAKVAKEQKAAKQQEVKEAPKAEATTEPVEELKATKEIPVHVKEIKPEDIAETVSEGPVLADKARVICDDNKITHTDIDVIDEAISQIKKSDPVSADSVKAELEELREDVEEYMTDVESLTAEVQHEKFDAELKDTTAGKRVQKHIGRMISRMEEMLVDLETSKSEEEITVHGEPLSSVAINDLVHTVQSLTQLPEDKLRNIFASLDTDKDGHINVTEASSIIKLLNKEDVEMTPKQLEQFVKILCVQFHNDKPPEKEAASVSQG